MRFLKIVLLFVAVFTAASVHAQSSAELKRQRDRLNEELQRLNHDLQDVQTNKKVTLKQLTLLKRKISVREEKIKIRRLYLLLVSVPNWLSHSRLN